MSSHKKITREAEKWLSSKYVARKNVAAASLSEKSLSVDDWQKYLFKILMASTCRYNQVFIEVQLAGNLYKARIFIFELTVNKRVSVRLMKDNISAINLRARY